MRQDVVFFGLSGGLGPVLRCLPVADLFREAGAEVKFSIYDASSQAYIQKLGYSLLYDDDPSVPAPERMVKAGSAFYDLDHYFAQCGMLDYEFARTWIFQRIRLLKRIKANLAVVDMSPHTVVAANYLGIPVVSMTQACFHPSGERLFAWGEAPRNLPKVTPVINKVLKELRMKPISRMEQLSSGDLDFIPGIPELDPVTGDAVHYVGPIGRKVDEDAKTSSEKDTFILVNPGRLSDTSGDSGLHIVKSIWEAFRDKDERILVAIHGRLPTKGLTRTKSIRIVPRYSTDDLKRCKLFIHHGGHGSCLTGIMQGLPSLIIPTHMEREYNARKVSQLGVAEYMLPGTFTAEHLYRMCKYMLQDDYKQRAMEWRQRIMRREYGGAHEVFARSKELLQA